MWLVVRNRELSGTATQRPFKITHNGYIFKFDEYRDLIITSNRGYKFDKALKYLIANFPKKRLIKAFRAAGIDGVPEVVVKMVYDYLVHYYGIITERE